MGAGRNINEAGHYTRFESRLSVQLGVYVFESCLRIGSDPFFQDAQRIHAPESQALRSETSPTTSD